MASVRLSAGLLMFRHRERALEVFLAHPGGPLFARRDEGCWTIPKGEPDDGEELLATAIREFREETGLAVEEPCVSLGCITQKGGKVVHAWAFRTAREDEPVTTSSTFRMEWPPHSGKWAEFPEVDRARFFRVAEARAKLKETQWPLVERLHRLVGG